MRHPHPDDLRHQRQLHRLRQLREDTARLERERLRRARDAAQDALQARDQGIATLRDGLDRLQGWPAGLPPVAAARWLAQAQTRRQQLLQVIERERYHRLADAEAVERAEQALAAGHAAWTSACARSRSAGESMARTRAALRQLQERRAELDQEPQPRAEGSTT